MSSPMVGAPAAKLGLLHAPEVRIEGREKVRGEAVFAADVRREGMLWAAFVASPFAHARIVRIDTSCAVAMPGVRAVLTGHDIGEHYFGRSLCDWPVLAIDRVLFIGQSVVAIAADSREQAEAAALTVEVEYDELVPLFDAERATAADAPILHPAPERYPSLTGPRATLSHPNLQGAVTLAKGDTDRAFAGDVQIHEHHFTTPRYHGGYIEPRATVVWIADDETVHVITTNKMPFGLRAQLAAATDVPAEKIVVEQARIGGDFGGKGLSVDEFPCYFLSKATGRPVKYVRKHIADVQSTTVRHASHITIRSAVTAGGELVGLTASIIFDGGAFAAGKPIPNLIPGTPPKLPYAIANVRLDIRSVYTNTVPAGHLRAPGDLQIMFALESHLDMVAAAMNIDPLAFRKRHAVRDGDVDADGVPYREPRAIEVLEALERNTNWNQPRPEGRAWGMALTARHIGHGAAGIVIRVRLDGRLELRTTLLDQGAGSTTALRRIAAVALGIDEQLIVVSQVATNAAPMDFGPGGSRVTNVTGRALLRATSDLHAQLTAAGWDGTPASWISSISVLLGDAPTLDIVGQFSDMPAPGEPELHNFSAFAADVSVDRATGEITVHEVVYVADVGTIVNPIAHAGQIEGGFVFGLGHALTEALVVEDGKLVNVSLADYKLPVQGDIPPLRTVLLEEPIGPGPFNAKAVGEISTAGVPPAIANAVAAACGVRVQSLPLTAELIHAALHRELSDTSPSHA